MKMLRWSLAVLLGLGMSATVAFAQPKGFGPKGPGPRGGGGAPGKGDPVQKIVGEIEKVRSQLKDLERQLEAVRGKGKGKEAGRGGDRKPDFKGKFEEMRKKFESKKGEFKKMFEGKKGFGPWGKGGEAKKGFGPKGPWGKGAEGKKGPGPWGWWGRGAEGKKGFAPKGKGGEARKPGPDSRRPDRTPPAGGARGPAAASSVDRILERMSRDFEELRRALKSGGGRR